MYFHYRKTVVGEIINTPLASSIVIKGPYFYNARLCSCGEQHKVGIVCMCPFLKSY